MSKTFLRAIALATLLCSAAAGAERAPREAVPARPLPRPYADGVVLAKPRVSHHQQADATEADAKFRLRQRFERLGDLRVLELPEGESVEGAVERLRATGNYEFVEPDYLMSIQATPNDPSFSSQWALNNTGQTGGVAGADIRAVAAWDIIREAPNVVVAVIDTGVRLDHQDIAPNLWVNPSPTFGDINGATFLRGIRNGTPLDDNGHGTHVAGIIGAAGNNGIAVSGVAWRVRLMILKNSDADGFSSASDSATCIDYAVANGAHIINCSFGGVAFSQTLFAAIRSARDAGVVVVAASGNSGLNNDATPTYPASYLSDNVIAVGNSAANDTAAGSSNFGAMVELFAPGTSILSLNAFSTAGTITFSGTSMASPMVAGSLALLKARFPGENHRQLINRLLRGADAKPAFATRAQTGGRLNLLRALSTTTNRPFNDDFADRAAISGAVIALRSSNAGATAEAGEPRIANANPTGSLWWTYTAATTGTIAVDTNGSDHDTLVAVYPGSGNTLAGLTAIAASDDAPGVRTSRVTLPVVAGTSYIISISGKDGAAGYTQLNIAPAQGGDVFTNPILLSGESARSTARNNFAAGDPRDPQILGNRGGASIWHRWTAPRSGHVQVSAFSADFDTLLAVHTGTSVENLTTVAASDDTDPATGIANTSSRCSFLATAGTSYVIQVDTKNAGTRGTFILTITDTVWQLSSGGEITGSPALAADGTLYFGTISPDRRVYAVDFDGGLKWTFTAGGSIDLASPAVADDGTVYVGSLDGKLTALRPDGTVRWQRDAGGLAAGISVSPAVAADGTIYARTNDGYLYAFAPADGAIRWRAEVGTTATSASAVIAADGTIYQPSNNQNLYAINPNGTERWRYVMGADTSTTPAIDAAGNIYAATHTRLFSLTREGSHRWSLNTGTTTRLTSSPTLSADGATVYIGTGDRRILAVNTSSGSANWTYTTPDAVISSAPAVDSNGTIYVGCEDGRIYALNPTGSLRRVWDAALGVRSSPAILGSRLYFGSRDAKVYAAEIGAYVASGPWPMYRHNPRRLGRIASDPLTLARAPQSRRAEPGDTVILSAAGVASGPVTYQWFKDGIIIPGATASSYTITDFSLAHVGSYTVTLRFGQGAPLTSPAAVLSLGGANAGRLVNLSILSELTAAEPRFTVGMVIGGAGAGGAKATLMRAVGPSLAPLGVASPLADPRIELFAGQTSTGVNDDWGGGAALAGVFNSVGAFAFAPAASKDSAIYNPALPAGNYTLQVSGVGNATGTVLAELYDATADGAFTAATPRLINVSVLKNIGAGATLTAGFVIGGVAPKPVLVRAIGPTLGAPPFNVGGVLADPRITLFRGAERIDENNDWGGGAALAAAFSGVGAFALAPDSRDAAMLVTLAPGQYSVQVTGAPGTSGLALVEVYEAP